MIERIDEMPGGVIGLRASGKLSKDDYTDVLEPALREDRSPATPGWWPVPLGPK